MVLKTLKQPVSVWVWRHKNGAQGAPFLVVEPVFFTTLRNTRWGHNSPVLVLQAQLAQHKLVGAEGVAEHKQLVAEVGHKNRPWQHQLMRLQLNPQ